MGTATQLKLIIRSLSRAPVFTAVTLLTIALGVGANTAIFSVIESVLLKPLPYSAPEELVGLWHTAPGIGMKVLNQSAANYFTYRDENRTFLELGLWSGGSSSVTGSGDPEQVPTLRVTYGTLAALRVRPLFGRVFSEHDDQPASPQTVVLTFGYWQRKFGGERSVLGRRILVDGQAREVIGVLAEDFHFLNAKPLLLLPFQFDRGKVLLANFSQMGLARLKPGVTLEQANADIARMLPMVLEKFPAPPGFNAKIFEAARIGPLVRPLEKDLLGDVSGVLWVLMGTVGLVLLIACANVANLLLVRAEARQQELAVRAALGAGSKRITRALLMESLTLGIAGGALGLGLAYAAVRLLVQLAPAGLPRIDEISIDVPVIVFAFAISTLAGVLFGLIPVWRYSGRMHGALRLGSRSFSQGRERHRVQSALVVIQVAMALVLVVGSGLMLRTFWAIKQVPPGFTEPEHLQTFRVSIPEAEAKEHERVARMQEEMLQKVLRIPGVTAAGLSSSLTMEGNGSNGPIFAEDRAYAPNELPPIRRYKFISPGYFSTVGRPLMVGRDITWTDVYNRTSVGLISENLAREYWGSPQAAIGKRIREGTKDLWREIIGVVSDERDDGANKQAPTMVYWPLLMKQFFGRAEVSSRNIAFAIRTDRAGTEGLLKEVREAVWSVNRNLPLYEVSTLREIYDKSMARVSFTLVMLGIAGAMALLLGVVGIYGVISYSVTQSKREIGIRAALGATQPELVGMFVRRGLRLAGTGVAFGLAAAAASTRFMESLLFEVRPVDPLTYAGVAAIVVLVAALASYVPSRQVSAAAPIEALRAE